MTPLGAPLPVSPTSNMVCVSISHTCTHAPPLWVQGDPPVVVPLSGDSGYTVGPPGWEAGGCLVT